MRGRRKDPGRIKKRKISNAEREISEGSPARAALLYFGLRKILTYASLIPAGNSVSSFLI